MLVCALAKAGIRRPVKFSGRRAMTSISWAFEIIEKFTDTIPYSCVTFGVIITLDPSRNGRGFGANLFTRQCHLSKTKLRTKIIHFAWINAFAQDNYQSERFYTELLASSVHIANVGRFLLPPKPRHRSDPITYGIAWIMSSCLASGTFAMLESYQRYYNEARTHLSLCKARRLQCGPGRWGPLPSHCSEDCTIDTSSCGASN